MSIPVSDFKMPYMPEYSQAAKNRQQIADIKRRYLQGEISREAAKIEAAPVIHRINELTVNKTKELNRKYKLKRRVALVDFAGLMR